MWLVLFLYFQTQSFVIDSTDQDDLAKTILQGTVKGGRRQGRQRKRLEDNIREWTGPEFAKSQRAVENREKWRKLVAKLSVAPQRPSRLRDRWWWWSIILRKVSLSFRSALIDLYTTATAALPPSSTNSQTTDSLKCSRSGLLRAVIDFWANTGTTRKITEDAQYVHPSLHSFISWKAFWLKFKCQRCKSGHFVQQSQHLCKHTVSSLL